MSIDKPTGGDSFPDRNSEGEDRPFPGAPVNREPVKEPTRSRTLDDVNAALDQAGDCLEFEAIERATRPTDFWSEPGSPDSGSPADGPSAGSGGGADASEGQGPEEVPKAEGLLRPDSELPPFPGAPVNREPVEAPEHPRTLEDVNAALDRSSNYLEFEAIDKATRPAGYEIPAPGPGDRGIFGTGGFSGRLEGARPAGEGEPGEQDSGDRAGPGSRTSADSSQQAQGSVSDQAGSQQAQEGAGARERQAEQPQAEAVPQKEVPGGPGEDPPVADVQRHPGQEPAAEAHQSGDKGAITHHHAEFHGQKLDLYTDGSRWVGGDAVRAAQAEAARTRTDGEPVYPRHGIADVPQMRDLGRNTTGEQEDRSPGDISDLPPTGEDLLESDDKPLSRPERFGRALDRHIDDAKDVASNAAATAQDLIDLPPSGAGHEVCQVIPPAGPGIIPTPYQAADVGSIAELALVAGVLGWHSYNKATDVASRLSDKISEWRDNQHAGN